MQPALGFFKTLRLVAVFRSFFVLGPGIVLGLHIGLGLLVGLGLLAGLGLLVGLSLHSRCATVVGPQLRLEAAMLMLHLVVTIR